MSKELGVGDTKRRGDLFVVIGYQLILKRFYGRLAEIQLRFHLLPRHARFAAIAFDRAAKLDQIFYIFETLPKPTRLSRQRF